MEIVNNSRIVSVLDKYSKNEPIGTSLLELQEKFKTADIYIPFLGVQGAGKSTLINSLIGRDLLPNEADETTCVPVEVRYSTREGVTLYFKDGKEQNIEPTKELLAEYVDNNYNPGNQKGVSHIVVSINSSILESGLVVVDLPGVGSLTRENEETTISYTKKMATVVFLISTVPQIRKKEAEFIKNVWRGAVSALFVQNIWTDNTEQEIDDALQYNKNILSSISEEIGIRFDGEIIPVNAYNAAFGRFNEDKSYTAKSNINELENKLTVFSKNYKEECDKRLRDRIHLSIEYVVDIIKERLSQVKMTSEQILDDLIEKRELYEDKKDSIKTIERNIEDIIERNRKIVRRFADSVATEKTNRLRAEMFHLIDEGLVDGEKLDTAFTNFQENYMAEVCDEVFTKMSSISEELEEEYNKLQIELSFEEAENYQSIEVNKEKKLKWEKGLKGGIVLGFDIGAIFAASSVTAAIGGGAGTGAVAGSAGGPIGTVVGVVVGIAVALIGYGIGSFAKKKITKKRGSETKRELEPLLLEYKNRIQRTVEDQSEQYFDSIHKEVSKYIDGMNAQLKDIKDEISQIRKGQRQVNYSEDELNKDLEYLLMWEENNA